MSHQEVSLLCPNISNSVLQFIYSNPTVSGETPQHGYEKLKASGPMAYEQHHADKVEYPHEHARHVQELKEKEGLFSAN